eukprot:GHVL01005281.1.p1 GENE.GHVL01005281.1~~GHVL01005281.1.p1  ORF type:complete len:741 (+),score=272.81 GHVL01005281.1:31-2253(+)
MHKKKSLIQRNKKNSKPKFVNSKPKKLNSERFGDFNDIDNDVIEFGDMEDEEEEEEEEDVNKIDEIDDIEDAADDDDDEVAAHQKELRRLASNDPDFYKFLKENDDELLSFKVNKEHVNEDTREELSWERYESIYKMAAEQKHIKFLPVLLMIYRSACYSLVGSPADNDKDEKTFQQNEKTLQNSEKTFQKKEKTFHMPKGLLKVTDDELVKKIISDVSRILPQELFSYFSKEKKKNEKNEKKKNIPCVTTYEKFNKIKMICRIFWHQTTYLIQKLWTRPDIIETVLMNISLELRWIIAYPLISRVFMKSVISVWACTSSHPVRLVAFGLLYNFAKIIKASSPHKRLSAEIAAQELKLGEVGVEEMIKMCYRSLTNTIQKGYTLSNFNAIQFLINCFCEIFEIANNSTMYRIMYINIKHLGNITRNSSEKKDGIIYTFVYICACRIWSICIIRNSKKNNFFLKKLCFPLVMNICCAIRSKNKCVEYIPYIIHLIKILHNIFEYVDIYIPTSTYILSLYISIIPIINKIYKNSKNITPGGGDIRIPVKPELITCIKYNSKQLQQLQPVEDICSCLCLLLVDYLGLLSRHPSFPEISLPIIYSIKKILLKNCTSDIIRKNLLKIIKSCKDSENIILEKRKNIKPLDMVNQNKFLIFNENDTPIGVLRREYCNKWENDIKTKCEDLLKNKKFEKIREEAENEIEENAVLTKQQQKRRRQKLREDPPPPRRRIKKIKINKEDKN